MKIEGLTRGRMLQCLDVLRASFGDADVISRRRDDCIVLRLPLPEHPSGSVIVKMWRRDDWKGGLRRFLYMSSVHHEWRNLSRMAGLGMPVPRPLGLCRVQPAISGYTDALFMEDLGVCRTASDHLKQLIRSGDEGRVCRFEGELIEVTARMVDAGILDADHGMLNTVVTADGRLVRLDVEIAQRVFWPRLFPAAYGNMLGRLIGLHAFAVQPDMARTTRFARRLLERLRPPKSVLKRAGAYARALMQKQLQTVGIETRLDLPKEYS